MRFPSFREFSVFLWRENHIIACASMEGLKYHHVKTFPRPLQEFMYIWYAPHCVHTCVVWWSVNLQIVISLPTYVRLGVPVSATSQRDAWAFTHSHFAWTEFLVDFWWNWNNACLSLITAASLHLDIDFMIYSEVYVECFACSTLNGQSSLL